MSSFRGIKMCAFVGAVLLVAALTAQATIVDDLNKMINTVNNLLTQATNNAKTAAQNAFNDISSTLTNVKNSALNAKQSAEQARTNINQLIDNSLIIYGEDLANPLKALLNCSAGIGTAITETTKIVGLMATASQVIPSELTQAGNAMPATSTAANAAYKETQKAAAALDLLSQKVSAWSGALQALNKETNDIAKAIQEKRFGDLPQQQQELDQARKAYQRAWNELQTQATATQTSLSKARLAVQAAGSAAGVVVSHLGKALDQVTIVVNQVFKARDAFNSGYNTCISAIDGYTNTWNIVVSQARQRFLNTLTAAQRNSILSLDGTVTQAGTLLSSINNAAQLSLDAAQPVVNAASSSITTAVSSVISGFVKWLQGFLTHPWDINITQLQTDLNNLLNTISTEVGKIVNSVYTAANPKKAEAENQLTTLGNLAFQLSQLYQQLSQAASQPTIILKTGFRLVSMTAYALSPIRALTFSMATATTSTKTQLTSYMSAPLQTLSTSITQERKKRKRP